MHVTDSLLMRELIERLERNHQVLRTYLTEPIERASFDQLAKLTIHRANGTVDLYEEEPFRERPAIGAMYAACDAGLRLLHVIDQIAVCDANRRRIGWATRDLRALISELFEWVIAPSGEPMLEIEA